MKGSKIPRIELHPVHLSQQYSLSMHNTLQYTWRGDYCKYMQPVQLPVITGVRAPSLLEQHPRYIPHRDRAGYTTVSVELRSTWASNRVFGNGPHHLLLVGLGSAMCGITCSQNQCVIFNPYPTAFPYGNGMVLHFYQQQESSTTKTVHKVINKGLKAYV